MQHFFLEPNAFQENLVIIKNPRVLHQMNHVLRMKRGDKFIALNNTGFEFHVQFEKIDKNYAEAKILEKRENMAEPKLFLTIYQALPKKLELFELVLQKGTEIGVSAFVALITERTERKNIPKRERFLKILQEAAEQCERGKIPKLLEPTPFEKAVEEKFYGARILLHSRGEYPLLSSKIADIKKANVCSIFIGPEGGFTEKEIQQAKENNFFIASLGPRVLRTETAGIVGAGVVLLYC